MARESKQLDTTIGVITPENISFKYRVAGPFRRFLAWLIDLAVRMGVLYAAYFVVVILFGVTGLIGFGVMLLLILWFLLDWFYGGILETYWNGQTIGKKLLGLRVLTSEGQPINGLQGVMRNVLRSVDSLPFFTNLVGFLAAMSNAHYQRLGDLACGTVVVIEDRKWVYGLVRIEDPVVIRLAGELPAKFEISKSLGQALASYVERRRYFSPARRADIARHVGEPLRVKFGLPSDTGHDLFVCALYYRVFVTDQEQDAAPAEIGSVPPVAWPTTAPAIRTGAS